MPTFDTKLKTWAMTAAGTVRPPVCRLSYPHLFKPKAMPGGDPDDLKYSVSLILPADTDMKPGVEMVRKVALERWGNKSNLKVKSPLLNHADKCPDDDLARDFPYLIRAASIYKPTVMYNSGEECKIEEDVYAGRWALVTVRPYAWEHPTGGKGVSFGLSNVLLLDHDDRIGGSRVKAEDEFAEYFQKGELTQEPDKMFGNGKGSSLFE